MAMADDPLYRLTLEASNRPLDPNRLATDLYLLQLRIYMEIDAIGEQIFNDTMLLELIELKDLFRLWGASFDARNGGLDKIPLHEDLRWSLLWCLCNTAKQVVNLARQTSLKETLVNVFQQIDKLDSYFRLGQPNDLSPATTVDDPARPDRKPRLKQRSPTEIRLRKMLKKKAFKKAFKNIEDSQVTLRRLEPTLYDIAEEARSAAPIGDSSKPLPGATLEPTSRSNDALPQTTANEAAINERV